MIMPAAGVHQADYYLALTTAAGLTPEPRVARIVPPDTAVAAAAGLVPSPPFVVLAPGAAYGRAKQWPPARYAELAHQLWRARSIAAAAMVKPSWCCRRARRLCGTWRAS